jgi:hypothetical protein
MNIIGEIESTDVVLDIVMSETEQSTLLEYADKNIPKEALAELKIEWALVDIIKNQTETDDTNDNEEDLCDIPA